MPAAEIPARKIPAKVPAGNRSSGAGGPPPPGPPPPPPPTGEGGRPGG